jgi:cobalamin synthase
MYKMLLFWMVFPDDQTLPMDQWYGFCNTMAGWVVICFLLATAVIIGLYTWTAHRKKIRRPRDLFAHYTPLHWLWLTWVPALIVFIVYAMEYQRLFRDAIVSYMAGAVWIGLETALLTFVLAYLLIMWIPRITPAKYRYRPRWMLYNRRGVMRR